MVYVNKKIMAIADSRGWSLYELAERADIPYSSLNSSINRDASPKIDMLERICVAFGITLSQFFIEDEHVEALSKKEKDLICSFRKLSDEKQDALLKILEQ